MSVAMLVGIAATAIVLFLVARSIGAWMKFRGDRVITCPENHSPAGVRVDAGHAAATALGAAPDLRLSSCSRWPEKQNCGQECLKQIEASPEDCLVRTIFVRWYAGKRCEICHREISSIGLVEQKPALLLAGGVLASWSEIGPEMLQDTLTHAKPVCFSCHQATSFARQHPELIVNRSRHA